MIKIQLSIIIPAYNISEYLLFLINTLASSIMDGVEFIFVNDGSTDDTLSILLKFSDKDSRIVVFDKPNGGVSSARNLGLLYAKGDYILFLDGDDSLSEDFPKILTSCMNQKFEFVFFRRWYNERQCEEFPYNIHSDYFKSVSEHFYKIENIETALLHKIFCSGSGEILLKRNLIGDIRFNESRCLLEDFDFFLSIIQYFHFDIYFCDLVLTHINDNIPTSLTRKIVSLNSLSPHLSESNGYLLTHHRLKNRVFWIETYFHFKKLSFFDRYRYLKRNAKLILARFSVNKYMIGCFFFLFGVDVNKIRTSLK